MKINKHTSHFTIFYIIMFKMMDIFVNYLVKLTTLYRNTLILLYMLCKLLLNMSCVYRFSI